MKKLTEYGIIIETIRKELRLTNKGKSLDDAIKCWKYKKSLEGHNRYERSDLIALE